MRQARRRCRAPLLHLSPVSDEKAGDPMGATCLETLMERPITDGPDADPAPSKGLVTLKRTASRNAASVTAQCPPKESMS